MEKALVTQTTGQPDAPAPPAEGRPEAVPAARSLRASFGHQRTFFDNRLVYAVISQRAGGLSIGVNLAPSQKCNFDCVYCEVNRNGYTGDSVDVEAMATELRKMLAWAEQGKFRELPGFQSVPEELLKLKAVALSGDGEPTLCPNFAEVVQAVVHLRAQGTHPFFKIVLFTNATGLDAPSVRQGLQSLTARDEIWAKLDGGTQDYLTKVNRPGVSLDEVMTRILNLGRERQLVIQSLFPLIRGEGPSPEEIEQYVLRLRELKEGGAKISLVQVYSAHRPPSHPECGHLPLKTLSRIAQRVREVTGLKAEVF